MKKLILMMALYGLFSFAFVNVTQAQIKLPAVKITSPDELPEKVAKAFQASFKGAEQPRWYHPNKNYVVTFLMDDIKHNALFTKNGYLIYHISYGNEKTIPDDLQPQVKSKFHGYSIIAAINVKQDGRNIWFITGEGEKDFLNVSIEDGVMSADNRSRRYALNGGINNNKNSVTIE